MLRTHGHWAVRVLKCATHIVRWGICYNGHFRGPVTPTPIAEHLAVELSLPVSMTYVCCGWDLKTQPSTCEVNAPTHCATALVTREHGIA